MTPHSLTREEVIERNGILPGFPRIVSEILATLDDPDANLKVLVHSIEHDPVIAARVLSRANVAATRSRGKSSINDIYTATSLIGMGGVREMVAISSIVGFTDKIAPSGMSATFWQHSVAVGVCSEELARYAATPALGPPALIAGLLHDVGQLWLYRYDAEAFHAAWTRALTDTVGIEEAERELFGIDHSAIGAWLAEYWELPESIRTAILYHHAPDSKLDEPLVPLVHVAEVLSNALDLTERKENRVTSISAGACEKLGLVWDESIRPIFGRMEARSRHANTLFL